MRTLFALCPALALLGCAADPTGGDDLVVDQPVPLVSGTYAGSYRVPVAADLEAAAVFDVPTIEWRVVDGVASLEYDLPPGLVGGKLAVEFSGPIAAGDREVVLTSEFGVATCVASATAITCREDFTGLGALPLDTSVVQAVAMRDYAGAVADRVAVAQVFGSDPIGFVTIDLAR